MSEVKKTSILYSDTSFEVKASVLLDLKKQYAEGNRDKLADATAIFASADYIGGHSEIVWCDRLKMLLEFRLSLTVDEYRRFGKLIGHEEVVNARIDTLLAYVEHQKKTLSDFPEVVYYFEFGRHAEAYQ